VYRTEFTCRLSASANRTIAMIFSAAMKFSSGLVLGIGLGGFVDGILLHQIVHWHNMGSSILPPVTMPAMEANMRWDGYFHAASWVITVVGVFLLRREAVRQRVPSVLQFIGQLTFGWGLFNLVEGVIDHQILGLHHVHDLPVRIAAFDWVFLAIPGVGFMLIGALLARPSRRDVVVPPLMSRSTREHG
jgi:uncharacterized membrane protein